ncbi:MAG TPA: hypothetical protein VHL80_03360 [Polyangia bacterium]|nr:hypothetical protein [Polyangia bacterium]
MRTILWGVLASRVRWPRPRSRALAARALRALWTLPTSVVGHLAGLAVSGGRPRRVGGPAARAWVYPIRRGLGLDWVGAVTLGHAILARPGLLDGPSLHARLTLAHELAHTRQHDWLGPLYLPLHALAQSVSAALSLGRGTVVSRVHDRNPLEQTFICLGAGATWPPFPPGLEAEGDRERFLEAFGA